MNVSIYFKCHLLVIFLFYYPNIFRTLLVRIPFMIVFLPLNAHRHALFCSRLKLIWVSVGLRRPMVQRWKIQCSIDTLRVISHMKNVIVHRTDSQISIKSDITIYNWRKWWWMGLKILNWGCTHKNIFRLMSRSTMDRKRPYIIWGCSC